MFSVICTRGVNGRAPGAPKTSGPACVAPQAGPLILQPMHSKCYSYSDPKRAKDDAYPRAESVDTVALEPSLAAWWLSRVLHQGSPSFLPESREEPESTDAAHFPLAM